MTADSFSILLTVVLAVSIIVIFLCFRSRKKEEAQMAALLAKSMVNEQIAQKQLEAAQLYNSAWFQSIKANYQEDQKAAKKWRAEHPEAHVHCWSDPESALELEDQMMAECATAKTEREAVAIIGQHVPKIIYTLLDESRFMDELPVDKQNRFMSLLNKYNL